MWDVHPQYTLRVQAWGRAQGGSQVSTKEHNAEGHLHCSLWVVSREMISGVCVGFGCTSLSMQALLGEGLAKGIFESMWLELSTFPRDTFLRFSLVLSRGWGYGSL